MRNKAVSPSALPEISEEKATPDKDPGRRVLVLILAPDPKAIQHSGAILRF